MGGLGAAASAIHRRHATLLAPKEAVETLDRCLEGIMGWNEGKRGEAKARQDAGTAQSSSPCTDRSGQGHIFPASARGTFSPLRLVRQLHPFLDKNNLAKVTHAQVTLELSYFKVLDVKLPLS